MSYFVVWADPDGGCRITELTEEELLKRLNDDGDYPPDKIRSDLDERDPDYWGDKRVLIIKGDIVVPKAVETVTKFSIK